MIPRRIFWLFDILTLILAFLTAYFFFPYIQRIVISSGLLSQTWLAALLAPETGGQLQPISDFSWIFWVMSIVTLFSLGLLGVYNDFFVKQPYIRLVGGTFMAAIIGLSMVTLIMFTLKSVAFSRIFVISFGVLAGVGLGLYRLALRGYLHQRRIAGDYLKNILLIGHHTDLNRLAAYFSTVASPYEYKLFGCLRLNTDPPPEQNPETRLPILGRVTDLGQLLIQRPIHEVVAIQSAASNNGWLPQVIKDCDHLGILLRIIPGPVQPDTLRTLQVLYPVDPLSLPAVMLKPPHQDSSTLMFKRVFDIVVSAVLLLLLSPLFLIIAVAIKITTPHLSVFYPWRVVGKNGVEFTGYKFTTMMADADLVKAQLLQYNEMSGPVFKIKDDPRITPLGRYLRKFSLNELPQLWSVLKGDMSLVGPRPAFRHELEGYEFWHKRKLSVRPGITCLWQVQGRNKIDNFDDWVKLDLEYIDNWSLWLDIKILFLTVWAVVGGTGS